MTDDIFTKRGISEEIRDARPYTRWETDDLEPVVKAYESLGRTGLDFALRIARQSPGWLIERFPPKGLGLEPIYPEFRPDNAVKTGHRQLHWHGRGDPPAWLPPSMVLKGRPLRDHLTRGGVWVKVKDGAVVEVGAGKDPDDHRGINTQAIHFHERWAKYVFPTAGRVDETWSHDHHATWHVHEGHSDQWIAAHVAKEHGGSEAAWYGQQPHAHAGTFDVKMARHVDKRHGGTDVAGEHEHTERKKDKGLNLARRLDIHPDAMDKIRRAEVVFLSIEGCMKADAILAKDAAVFSVPSVSLWDCPELETFARTYLNGKEIVIVPDADWATNPEVVSQARLCHATLNRYDVARVHIAAAPVVNGSPTRGKGVDDFLGKVGHGQLNELQTVDFYLAPATRVAINSLLERCTRADQDRRNRKVLESMAIFAGPSGVLPSSLQMVSPRHGA